MHLRPSKATRQPRHLFVYGSLVDPGCLEEVLGHRHLGERLAATLADYQRIAPASSGYPYIIRAPGARVDGLLILDLNPSDLRALDRYEEVDKGVYCRRLVAVEAWGCGRQRLRLIAHTYIAGPGLGAAIER